MKEKRDCFLKKKNDRQEGASADLERCVICGRLTDVRKDTPVSERKTYLAGSGQMCADCCYELYHTTDLRELSESWGER